LEVSTGAPGPVELYNLVQDIAETNDVSGQYPEIVNERLNFMNKAHTPGKLFSSYADEDIAVMSKSKISKFYVVLWEIPE